MSLFFVVFVVVFSVVVCGLSFMSKKDTFSKAFSCFLSCFAAEELSFFLKGYGVILLSVCESDVFGLLMERSLKARFLPTDGLEDYGRSDFLFKGCLLRL